VLYIIHTVVTCVILLIVQSDVLSKGLGKFVFTEWTGQERHNTESLLWAERIGHVGWLCCSWNKEEGA